MRGTPASEQKRAGEQASDAGAAPLVIPLLLSDRAAPEQSNSTQLDWREAHSERGSPKRDRRRCDKHARAMQQHTSSEASSLTSESAESSRAHDCACLIDLQTRNQTRMARRTAGTALLLLCCLAVASATVVILDEAAAPADASYVQAELYPAAPRGSSTLLSEWSDFILGEAGLLTVAQTARQAPPLASTPNQRGTPDDYEVVRVGKVSATDLTPMTEGYRPTLHGYFQATAECDQFLRMWADQCAFKDEAQNIYHKAPAPFFQPGEDGNRKSSATYLSEVMNAWEETSPMAKSVGSFGGNPKTANYHAPTALDSQAAPPN